MLFILKNLMNKLKFNNFLVSARPFFKGKSLGSQLIIIFSLPFQIFYGLISFAVLNFGLSKYKNEKCFAPVLKKKKSIFIKKVKKNNGQLQIFLKNNNNPLYYPFQGLPFENNSCRVEKKCFHQIKELKAELLRVSINKKKKKAPLFLDLGCGNKKMPGFFGVDIMKLSCVDLVRDIEQEGLPFSTSSILHIRCFHFLEHVNDPIKIINECWRVLVKHGTLEISVPTIVGGWAFADLTHRNFFNQLSFFHYFDHRFSRTSYSGIVNRWEIVEQNISQSLHVKMVTIK